MLKWLRYLWQNEDGFFGIGLGPSSQEKQQYGALANIGNFGTSQGEGDISASDNFFKAILSGDPTKISQVLGPSISAANKSGQEQKKTLSEFGNRSGGTNAAAQNIDTNTRSSIDQAIASLTGNAASALGASGQGLLAAGLSGHEAAFSEADTIHQQHSAQINDLFKSIASVVGGVAGGFAGGGEATPLGLSPGQISSAFGGPGSATPDNSNSVPDFLS